MLRQRRTRRADCTEKRTEGCTDVACLLFSLGTPLPALDAIKGTVLRLSSSEGHCLRQMPLEDLKSKPDQAANEKRETD